VRIFSYFRAGRDSGAAWAGAAGSLLGIALLSAGLWAHPTQAQFPAELQVRVADALTGTALAGVRISIPGQDRDHLTDGQGGVHIRGLTPGEVEVVVRRLGYREKRVRVEVRNGATVHLSVSLVPEALTLEGVSVAARSGGAWSIERDRIERAGAGTLGDLLALTPGVVIVRRGGGGAEEIRLRGGSASDVLVLIDGVPLNDPLTGVADLSLLPSSMLERVQVVPGARTARYGPGAMAGVVLVETRRSSTPLEARAGVGSLGERRGDVALLRKWEPVTLSAGTSTGLRHGSFDFDQPDVLGGGRHRRSNADFSQSAARVAASGVRDRGDWHLRVRYEDLDRGVPGKSFAPSASARQRLQATGLTGGVRIGGPAAGLEIKGHGQRLRSIFLDPEPPLGIPFDDRSELREGGGVVRYESMVSRIVRLERMGVEVAVSRRLLAGDVIEDRRAGDTEFSLAGDIDVAPPGLPSGSRVGLALRGHRAGERSDGWLAAHDVSVHLPASSNFAELQFGLAHRSSFSPPTLGDLHFREGVGTRPNPNLRAERIRGELELGFSGALGFGSALVDLSGEVFTGDVRDMIVWLPDFRFVWSPRNVNVRRDGGEIRGRVHLGDRDLSVGGHLSINRVTYRDGVGTEGVQVVYRPRTTGGIDTGWRRGGWFANLHARHVGMRYPVPAAANALDPFWTVEASAGGEFTAGSWSLHPLLRIDRLNDAREPFIHAFPEPGRTFRFELRAVRSTPD